MNTKMFIRCSITPILLFFVLFYNPVWLDKINLPADALLSGLLALAGFMFGARTFLVFKLQEVIYSNQNYIAFHEKITEQLGFKQGLYEPLDNLDTKINHSVIATFILIIILSFYIFLNLTLKSSYIFSSILLAFLVYDFIAIAIALISINRNIKSIIEFWSADEKRMKDKL